MTEDPAGVLTAAAVTDVERSRTFYSELLGFQTAMDTPPPVEDPHHDLTLDLLQGGIVLANGDLLLGLRPVDADRATDRFNPLRCGLDHLSFSLAGRADLEAAVRAFEERGVEHSPITRPAALRHSRAAVQRPRRTRAGTLTLMTAVGTAI